MLESLKSNYKGVKKDLTFSMCLNYNILNQLNK
jgi:hypothetical protein